MNQFSEGHGTQRDSAAGLSSGVSSPVPSPFETSPREPSLLDEIIEETKRHAAIEEQLREKPIFTTGEVLLIRGGFFKVHSLTGERMTLDFQGEAGQVLKEGATGVKTK